jgi:predicted nucleic acid-binding Zn ribbon protein
MYCTNCGAWNPDESKFCAKCGQRLEEPGQAEKRGIVIPARVVALLGLLIVLIALCVGAYAMRDRIRSAWQGLTATPTKIAVLPTATPSQVAIQASATPTWTATASPSPTMTEIPSPTASPLPTATPTPPVRTFKLIYRDCIPHGFALGSVKGQVFDRSGKVIPGAKVRITINGYEWQSEANPATTNADGWYEWTLDVGQKVQFVELIVDGKSVPFSPQEFEVKAQGSCFQRVDFVEQ